MEASKIDRREFVKILGLTPFLYLTLHDQLTGLFDSSASEKPNILIIVFDAFSANNMSLYGYKRHTTPNIDKFAERGTVYHRHYSGGNYTPPGTASLLTGVYPWKHRAIHSQGYADEFFNDRNIFGLLGSNYNTFAYTHNPFVRIQFHFYRHNIDQLTTISDLALISDSLTEEIFDDDYFAASMAEKVLKIGNKNEFHAGSMFISLLHKNLKKSRYKRLVNAYQKEYPRGVTRCGIETTPYPHCFLLEDNINWLKDTIASQQSPFLGYVHFFPPHGPYTVPKKYINHFLDNPWKPTAKPHHPLGFGVNNKDQNRARLYYDQSIAYVDYEFSRLFKFLRDLGYLENTYLVLTSDHGEIFERGIVGHVTEVLFDPLLHIPLIIWKPGQTSRKDIYATTSATDILPTLLQSVGTAVPSWIEGQFLPGMDLPTSTDGRSVFSVEAKTNPRHAPLTIASFSMVKDDAKIVHYSGYKKYSDVYELYNLKDDPEELENIFDSEDSFSKAMKEELDAKIELVNKPYQK